MPAFDRGFEVEGDALIFAGGPLVATGTAAAATALADAQPGSLYLDRSDSAQAHVVMKEDQNNVLVDIGVFGSKFAKVIDHSSSSTTGTTYLNKLTLQVTVPVGTYRIGVRYSFAVQTSNVGFQSRIVRGTTPLIEFIDKDMIIGDSAGISSLCVFFLYDDITVAGTYTYYLQWCSDTNRKEAAIANAAMEFWRVQ